MEPGPKMKGVQREWKYEMCVEDCERLQKCTLIVLPRYIYLWTHARRVNLKISISSHAKHNRFFLCTHSIEGSTFPGSTSYR